MDRATGLFYMVCHTMAMSCYRNVHLRVQWYRLCCNELRVLLGRQGEKTGTERTGMKNLQITMVYST